MLPRCTQKRQAENSRFRPSPSSVRDTRHTLAATAPVWAALKPSVVCVSRSTSSPCRTAQCPTATYIRYGPGRASPRALTAGPCTCSYDRALARTRTPSPCTRATPSPRTAMSSSHTVYGPDYSWGELCPCGGESSYSRTEMRKGIKNCPCGGERVELVYKAVYCADARLTGGAAMPSRPQDRFWAMNPLHGGRASWILHSIILRPRFIPPSYDSSWGGNGPPFSARRCAGGAGYKPPAAPRRKSLTTRPPAHELRTRGSPGRGADRVQVSRPDDLAWASGLPPRAQVKHPVDGEDAARYRCSPALC